VVHKQAKLRRALLDAAKAILQTDSDADAKKALLAADQAWHQEWIKAWLEGLS
jgi:hypothetical protein